MAEATLTPYLECGRVINTHGCRGGIKVEPWADSPMDLCRLGHLFLRRGADMLPLTVRRASVMKGQFLLLEVEGVTDMDAALALKGKVVSIRREDARLPEGEYFDEELVGLTVLDDASGEELGRVDRVLTYPAHKIYQVKGAHEYLIPAVPGVFIASVDPAAGVMRVHLMKGLATDEN